jgi:hypothetical protein
MKLNRSIIIAFGLLFLACSLYRIWDGRPFGFAPQIAMAIFGGAVLKDKKWSFLLPLLSMFLSDLIYQVLYSQGLSSLPGFYEGQVSNYILFTALTCFGFMIRSFNPGRILVASVAAPTVYFLLSNLLVWTAGAGYGRATLLLAYADGLPFYANSIAATILFSAVFFGVYYFVRRSESPNVSLAA